MATEIIQKYRDLRSVQRELRSAGAEDTEPDAILEVIVKRALKGEPVDWVKGRKQGWDLYSGERKAISTFTKALKEFYTYATAHRKDVTLGELEDIKGEMWRVDWDCPLEESDMRF